MTGGHRRCVRSFSLEIDPSHPMARLRGIMGATNTINPWMPLQFERIAQGSPDAPPSTAPSGRRGWSGMIDGLGLASIGMEVRRQED